MNMFYALLLMGALVLGASLLTAMVGSRPVPRREVVRPAPAPGFGARGR